MRARIFVLCTTITKRLGKVPGTYPLKTFSGHTIHKILWAKCHIILSDNILSQKQLLLPSPPHPRDSPNRRDNRKAQPAGPISLSSELALPAS